MLVRVPRTGETIEIADDIQVAVLAVNGGRREIQGTLSEGAMSQQLEDATATLDTLNSVEAHVRRRLNGRVREFRLSMSGSGLILEGVARTYHAKQLAQHAVMEATELPISGNDIEVK